MKRILFLAAGLAIALLLVPARTVSAQYGTWRATPANAAPRQGVARPAQRVVVIQQPVYYPPAYYPPAYYQPQYSPYGTYPVAMTAIPAVLMSDGSIWADFGFGFQPVNQACSYVSSVNGSPLLLDAAGNVITGGGIRYMPPAPAQMTASEQNLPSVQAARRRAQAACFSRDSGGRYFVLR